MPYDARVFQILIASPGDVQAERDIIAEVIYEWNYVNSHDRRIVLLPLRWETHSSPEMGERPQGVINRQIVEHCDMAVGVFWTRMGTPTSEAESGTAEEVEEVGRAGKPVMIYFSRAKVDLDSVDLSEYGRLRQFKEKAYPQGLIEKYASIPEFRDKFSRQLAMKIRELVAQDLVDRSRKTSESREILVLRLAKGDPPEVLPEVATVEVEQVVCSDESEIPDFVKPREVHNGDNDRSGSVYSISGRANPDYYQELVRYYRRRDSYVSFRLAVSSVHVQGVRDLYLELIVTSKSGDAQIVDRNPSIVRPQEDESSIVMGDSIMIYSGAPTQMLRLRQESLDSWKMELEVPVVHATRVSHL